VDRADTLREGGRGIFDNVGGGDWAGQAADAQVMADQIMKDSGYGSNMQEVVGSTGQMAADQAALMAQADENNRILTVGSPAAVTIVSKTDLGRKVAGNDTWLLELEVTPEGGTPYTGAEGGDHPAAGDRRLRRRHHDGRADRSRRSIVDTGRKFDRTSIYDVTLDVVADGHAPFQVVHRQMIAAAALGNWQPGKVLPVRFAPAAPAAGVTIG